MALRIEIPTDLDNIEGTYLIAALQALKAEHISGGEWHHTEGVVRPEDFHVALRTKLCEVAGSKGEPFIDELIRKVKIEIYHPPADL